MLSAHRSSPASAHQSSLRVRAQAAVDLRAQVGSRPPRPEVDEEEVPEEEEEVAGVDHQVKKELSDEQRFGPFFCIASNPEQG